MTDSPERVEEPATGPVATLPPPPPPPGYVAPIHPERPNRLYQVAAWVAIVAGVIFIVGAVFFTGFALGRHSGNDGGWRHHYSDFRDRGERPMMPIPMMPGGPGGFGPGGPGGPGAFGPGGPGGFGPGGPGPGAGPMMPGSGGPGATATPTPRP